jgi:hypothetical protein
LGERRNEAGYLKAAAEAFQLRPLRGGSQAIAFEGGWLTVTHEVSIVDEKRVNPHRFVWLDSDDRVQHLTEPFVLRSKGLEFCAGMCQSVEKDELILSFGVGDAEAWVANVSASDVRLALDLI